MSAVIQVANLGKRYRLGAAPAHRTLSEALGGWLRRGGGSMPDPQEFWALRGLSFEVQAGEAVGIIGRNGAGKSTLLKLLSRITDPTEGSYRMRGRVASLLEVGTGFHPELTGRENIFLNGAVLGMRRREVARQFDPIVEYAGVGRFIDTPIKRYSTGMQLRLAFSVSAFLESEILVVDEVLAVGDAAFQQRCLGTMQDAARGGRTVLLVSHNMAAARQLTRRCVVLDQGGLVFDGATEDAVQHYVGLKQPAMSPGRKPLDQYACDRRVQHAAHVYMTAIGLALGQADEIAVGGELRLEVEIEATTVADGLRLAYSFNAGGQPVLTGLTPAFTQPKGRQVYELVIRDLPLAPDEYDLSVILGTGGLREMKLEFDAILGFGRVRVAEHTADGEPLGFWYRGWARVVHEHNALRPLETP